MPNTPPGSNPAKNNLSFFDVSIYPYFAPMAITVISIPSGLCLAGNLSKLTLTANADVRIQLQAGDRTLLDETYTPDFNNTISLDISEVVSNSLSVTIPTSDVYTQLELVKTFTIKLNNSSVSFTAIRAGIKRLNAGPGEFLTKNFLTWQPQLKEVVTGQPEWLTYYTTQNCYLYVTAELDSHNTLHKKIATFTANNAYTVNTSVERITALIGQRPAKYDVYVVATDNPAGTRLSNIQQYRVIDNVPNKQLFCFQNSLGGIDTVHCTGEAIHAPEYTVSTALMNETEDTYYIEKKDLQTQNTGWLSKAAGAWLHDFFASKQRYIYEDESLQPVVIDEVTAETSTTEDLFAFEFTCRPAVASTLLNLKRDFGTVTSTWSGFVNVPEFVQPTAVSEWTGFVNVWGFMQPTSVSEWSGFVNVLRKTGYNAYSHAYSRAYNNTSPSP
jgi:hypothetical protein